MQEIFNNTEIFTAAVLGVNLLLDLLWKKDKFNNILIKLILRIISGWSFYLLIK